MVATPTPIFSPSPPYPHCAFPSSNTEKASSWHFGRLLETSGKEEPSMNQAHILKRSAVRSTGNQKMPSILSPFRSDASRVPESSSSIARHLSEEQPKSRAAEMSYKRRPCQPRYLSLSQAIIVKGKREINN